MSLGNRRRRAAGAISSVAAFVGALAASVAGATSPQSNPSSNPMVPGYEVLRVSGLVADAALGEVLLGELNCLSCHAVAGPTAGAVAARISTKPAPDLREIGQRASGAWIARFIADPDAVKPGTTMPAMLGGVDGDTRQDLADRLARFLVAQSGVGERVPYAPFRFRAAVQRGRGLFRSVGCAACHGTDGLSGTPATPDVRLPDLAAKNFAAPLARFLIDPSRARPGMRMPSLHLTQAEANDLTVYLLRDQAVDRPARVPGFEYEYYIDTEDEDGEGFFTRPPPDFDAWEVSATGRISRLSLELPTPTRWGNHGFRYSALMALDSPGEYTFTLTSDRRSGSELIVDGEVVATKLRDTARIVEGTVPLGRGDHEVSVTYYIRGDTPRPFLEATVSGRGLGTGTPLGRLAAVEDVVLEPRPAGAFRVDLAREADGARLFVQLGCSACHALASAPSDIHRAIDPPAFTAATKVSADWTHRATGSPRYGLSAGQKRALGAALENLDALAGPRSPDSQIVHSMATHNCYACHTRALGDRSIGGPDPVREPLFRVVGGLDLGEEGRLPPTLDAVGGRLKPAALESIVTEDRLHVRRPFMQTRMPGFGGELMATLADAFDRADAHEGDLVEPAFSAQAVQDGLWLLGSKGLRCITCHDVGINRAPGISTIDLTTVYERLRPGWVEHFLRRPIAVRPGTRMPTFWDGEDVIHADVAGGTASGQIAAIWSTLSLGASMPAPEGMDVGDAMVLAPDSEVIVFRTFMNEVSPRAIAAGFPESVHVAFDANVVRLAKVWRGGFFDAKGTWQGRAGRFLSPHGVEVVNLPPGPAFAYLTSPDAPWPQPMLTDRDLGGEFLGYRLDEQRGPTFRYRLGEVEIDEQPVPAVGAGGANLIRRFTVRGSVGSAPLYLLVAEGEQVDSIAASSWSVDGELTVSLHSTATLMPIERSSQGVRQVLVPIDLGDDGTLSIEVEIQW